jgi:hypothetical protein
MAEGDEFPQGHLVGIAANFLPVAEFEADLAVNAVNAGVKLGHWAAQKSTTWPLE